MPGETQVAILDNGIIEAFEEELENNIYVDDKNNVAKAQETSETKEFFHGTNCFLILKYYSKNMKISSVKILNDEGKGNLEKLAPALEWCLDNSIKIVNLSFGTTHFKDEYKIQNIINHYANQGLIFISASSNSGYTSYPAYFSNVVGVANIEDYKFNKNIVKINDIHTGIDFLASSEHSVSIFGEVIKLTKSNSYAAPFVTSLIYNMLINDAGLTISKLKRRLAKESRDEEFFYCEPNWIENAYIIGGELKSRSKTYFNLFKDCKYESIKEKIDTLIIFNKEDLEAYLKENKHVIYLGNDFSCPKCIGEKYIWDKSFKEKKIDEESFNDKEIDIPIIMVKFYGDVDEVWILQQLKKLFGDKFYNAYVSSTKPEGILYNLEYIPKKYIDNYSENKNIKSFIEREVFYKRSDLIIAGIGYDVEGIEGFLQGMEVELVIDIENKDGYQVTFNDINGKKIIKKYKCIDINEISSIFKVIMESLKGE